MSKLSSKNMTLSKLWSVMKKIIMLIIMLYLTYITVVSYLDNFNIYSQSLTGIKAKKHDLRLIETTINKVEEELVFYKDLVQDEDLIEFPDTVTLSNLMLAEERLDSVKEQINSKNDIENIDTISILSNYNLAVETLMFTIDDFYENTSLDETHYNWIKNISVSLYNEDNYRPSDYVVFLKSKENILKSVEYNKPERVFDNNIAKIFVETHPIWSNLRKIGERDYIYTKYFLLLILFIPLFLIIDTESRSINGIFIIYVAVFAFLFFTSKYLLNIKFLMI